MCNHCSTVDISMRYWIYINSLTHTHQQKPNTIIVHCKLFQMIQKKYNISTNGNSKLAFFTLLSNNAYKTWTKETNCIQQLQIHYTLDYTHQNTQNVTLAQIE